MRKHETITTKKFAFLIVTMWTESYPYFAVFGQILRFNVKVSYSSMPNMKNIDIKK